MNQGKEKNMTRQRNVLFGVLLIQRTWRSRLAIAMMMFAGLLLIAAAPADMARTSKPASTGHSAALAQPAPDFMKLADVTRQLGPELPKLLGMESPQTYLILVQNNHELRATGGFIAAIGRVTLDKGKMTELDFVDSYAVFRADGDYPPPPAAMLQYMGIPQLVMRDANWSPDFPTVAQVARTLYRSDTGLDVDGIVTVDLNAVKHIFGALGEIQVPGFDNPITGDNIESQIVQLWERPAESAVEVGGETAQELGEWWQQRKDFIPRLSTAALDAVQGGQASVFRLTAAGLQALNDRSIQVWLKNPTAAAVMHAQGWDGALQSTVGRDFLAVIDTNMGYNKVDAAMQRALDYRVNWLDGADQPARATVTLTYTHPIDAEDPGCDLTPRYGNSYADLIARCYFDYVRIYTPSGSKLIEATGVDPESVSSQRGERRTQVFAGYFILPPGESNVVTFTYTLPPSLTPETYQLLVQRQSGTQPLPLTVTVDGVAQAVMVDGAVWEWPE